MNGTTTMQIISTGVDAKDFEEAILKVKNLANFQKENILLETENEFVYKIAGKFRCLGKITSTPLNIIK
jgi:hypothetical protein